MNQPSCSRGLTLAAVCGAALWMGAAPCPVSAWNRYEHPDCWLRFRSGYVGPFTGANPADAELFEALRAVSAQYRVPLEIVGAVCFQESGLRQYGADGVVVHNLGECAAQYYGAGGAPPGLGLMQLTGSTAETFDQNRLITDWRYNLEAGVKILRHKYAVALGRAPPALQRLDLAHWVVLENWRYALAEYNGFRYPENPYVEAVCGHVAAPPAPLAGLYAGVPVARPIDVMPGFAYGQAYAVTPFGAWHDATGAVQTGAAHRGSDMSGRFPAARTAGDYDGDQYADPVFYSPADGAWRVHGSAAGYAGVEPAWRLGGPGWAAAPADYDGDGRADPTVYRESGGVWRLRGSRDEYRPREWAGFLGGPGWAAAPADYDGDGRVDPAVYRESGGAWNVALSSAGYRVLAVDSLLGASGLRAAPADYDGDRLADPAVYAGADGTWQLLLSSSQYTVRLTWRSYLGGPGWTSEPADYDGDGLADPAVRTADGVLWQATLSGGGYAPVRVSLPAAIPAAGVEPNPADPAARVRPLLRPGGE